VWIEYKRGDRVGFIGIETKLTEPFSPQQYPFDTGPRRYSNWLATPGWWWQPGAEQRFSDPVFNRRNHLLAFAMINQPERRYAEAFCAVIHHDSDDHCPGALKNYRTHLTPAAQPTLLHWKLGDLARIWQSKLTDRRELDWLNAFRLRYVALDASQPAWSVFQPRKDR
jgi:hypothetical protein